jgi:hypothetical protein
VRNEVAAGYIGMSEERSCSGIWKGGCEKELKLWRECYNRDLLGDELEW